MSLTSRDASAHHAYAHHVDVDADELARHCWAPEEYRYGRLSLSSSTNAPVDACRWSVDHEVAERLPDTERTILMMVLSELVTNAVRHAGRDAESPIVVHLGVAESALRVEVCDPGNGFALTTTRPALRELPWRRGLLIVDAIASRWGAAPCPTCHCVWAEVDRPLRQLRPV